MIAAVTKCLASIITRRRSSRQTDRRAFLIAIVRSLGALRSLGDLMLAHQVRRLSPLRSARPPAIRNSPGVTLITTTTAICYNANTVESAAPAEEASGVLLKSAANTNTHTHSTVLPEAPLEPDHK
jgi:hypothetical protein